jgi:hypothetical protein
MFQSRTGKTIGLVSFIAPLAGYVVRDLRKPNSLIRNLLVYSAQKFLRPGRNRFEIPANEMNQEIAEDEIIEIQ